MTATLTRTDRPSLQITSSRRRSAFSPRALTANIRRDLPDAYVVHAVLSQLEDRRYREETEERLRREDAEDRAVALPRLRRYRKGSSELIKHEDLMRELDIDLE